MMIIDSGVHVWLPEGPDRPWMPGRTAHLPEPLTYQKFAAMMDDAGVSSAVLVPPSWEGERIDYSAEVSRPVCGDGTLFDQSARGTRAARDVARADGNGTAPG
jgi:hypothetical protein